MSQFVQPLESRQMLSASLNQTVDEAAIALDVRGIIADANSAKSTLTTDAKSFGVQLKKLNLKNAPLGKALASAINLGQRKITYDVWKIVSTGSNTGKAIFNDWLKIQFVDSGNSAALAKDQAKLLADVKKIWNIEQPLIDKFQADFKATETNVEDAVQAIVDGNKSNTALSNSWTTLQGDITTATKNLSADFSQLTVNVNNLIADS